MTSKIAVVTGGNKGIGAMLVRKLAETGCMVWLGARNAELGQAEAQKLQQEKLNVKYIHVDLDDRQSIIQAADKVSQESEHVDILINNAAIISGGFANGVSKAKLDTLERDMQVNYIGTVAVTQAFLPLVRKSHSGRIINVSSDLGSLTLQNDYQWEYAGLKLLGYSASKAALNMMTVHLAYELRDTPIKVNSVNPGSTATDLNNHRGHQTVEEGAAEALRVALLPDDGPTAKFLATGREVPW